MTRNEFLKKLKQGLKGLPEADISESLSDYELHFTEAKTSGRSESKTAESLGDPVHIAKQIRSELMIAKAEETKSVNNISRAILATAMLGFFNLVFVLGPVLGIAGALLGLIVSGISIVASGIVATLAGIIGPILPFVEMGMHPAVILFLGISLTAFGGLFCIGIYYLNILFYKLVIKYLKLNINLIKQQNNE